MSKAKATTTGQMGRRARRIGLPVRITGPMFSDTYIELYFTPELMALIDRMPAVIEALGPQTENVSSVLLTYNEDVLISYSNTRMHPHRNGVTVEPIEPKQRTMKREYVFKIRQFPYTQMPNFVSLELYRYTNTDTKFVTSVDLSKENIDTLRELLNDYLQGLNTTTP